MIATFAGLLLASVQAEERPGACTPQTAQATTVAAIGANLGRWTGRCVTLSGPGSSTQMWIGVEGIYQLSQLSDGGFFDTPEARLRRISLYLPRNARSSVSWSPKGLRHLVVTGRVDSCERLSSEARASSPDHIVMMTGYCHSYGGPVILAQSVRVDPDRRYVRLLGDRARALHGDLMPAPGSWRHLARLRELASSFRAALLAGDRARLLELHDKDVQDVDGQELLASLLDSPDSPWAQVRSDPSRPMKLFVPTRPTPAEVESADELFGLLCICRTPDCTGRWPIASIDADNAPTRPYVCTSIGTEEEGERRTLLGTRISRRQGLGEPAHTAFRR